MTKTERRAWKAKQLKRAKKLAKLRRKQKMRREKHCRRCGAQFVGYLTMDETCTPCLTRAIEELKAQKTKRH